MTYHFNPEHDEIHVSCTHRSVLLELRNQQGDTFVVELDETALDYVLPKVLAFAWALDRGYSLMPTPCLTQEDLPF